jgi:regulation of enolase protein 1 (concanavalin A-like superfamily)
VIYPAQTGQIELPDWRAKIVARNVVGAIADTNSVSFSLTEPAVTWGRLTGNVWLRLQRRGHNFTASVSYDGTIWKFLPHVVIPLNKNLFTGITVSSGMPDSTTVFFDNVSIHRSK